MRATQNTTPRRKRNLLRVYLIAIGLAVLPLTAFIIGAHKVLLHETTNQIFTRSARSGKSFAALVERPLTDNTTYLQSFAQRSELVSQWQRTSDATLAALLAKAHKLRPEFAALGLYGVDGRLRATSPAGTALLGTDYHFADLSSALQAGKAAYVSPAYRLASEPGYAMAIAVPVSDENGRALGMVVGQQTLETMTHEVYGSTTPETSALFFVVDQTGQIFGFQKSSIVAVPGHRAILESVTRQPPKDTGQRLTLDSQEVIAAYSPIPSAGWGILVNVPMAAITQSLWKSEGIFGFLVLILLLLAVAGGGVVAAAFQRFRTREEKYKEQIEEQNRELEQRAGALAATNKELEEFSHSVAHDLRAPLRHIVGFTKILVSETGDQFSAAGKRYLDLVCSSASQMGQLIDQLLDFSRLGRRGMSVSSTQLNSIIDDVLSELSREYVGRNIEWKIAPLPLVECDPALTRQVFMNLLSNAVKYTRPRDPAVIEVGAVQRGPGRTVFFVRDNGVGFSMKHADQLFGVFQRLHHAEDFEGTGVGLATVRRIVHKHGGQIWAEAEPDHGATFYFSFTQLDAPEHEHAYVEAGAA
jgi:signal transduction histidine kinase